MEIRPHMAPGDTRDVPEGPGNIYAKPTSGLLTRKVEIGDYLIHKGGIIVKIARPTKGWRIITIDKGDHLHTFECEIGVRMKVRREVSNGKPV